MAILNYLDDYQIDTDVYEGPLDLLLDLIQKEELEITSLSLAKVTDQYLAYILNVENISPDHLSEFLIIAAKLIQIKSEALLPKPPQRDEDEENLGESLARQLRIYREIKNTSNWLKSRTELNLRTYLHTSRTYSTNIHLDLGNINVDDLVSTMLSLYSQESQLSPLGTVISIPKVTLRKQVQSILNVLIEKGSISFNQILDTDNSRLNVIVVFLAVLELVKQDYITTQQGNLFSDIEISATEKVFQNQYIEFSIED